MPTLNATLENAIAAYLVGVKKMADEHYAKHLTNLVPPTFRAEYGSKYAKILKVDDNGSRCVHSFIALVDVATKGITAKAGDILKPASWSAPARHARGSVFNANPVEGVSAYGPDYLR